MAYPTPDLNKRTVVAGGIEFALLETGPESGRLVICMHGFPDTAWTWRHLLPALGQAGYHAVAPFLRGYAPTGLAPDGAYQSGALATDACELHGALGGGPGSILIGHDWGALAAYGAASLAPDRFEKVVTMAVPPVAVAAQTFLSYEQLKRSFYVFVFQTPLAELIVSADEHAFIDRLWADWSPGYEAAWDVARVKESIGSPERLSAAISYYRAMLDGSSHLETYGSAQEAAGRVPPQPTLYLHGAQDGCMAVPSAEAMQSVLSEGSDYSVVEGAGHFLHLEKPGEVESKILRFLEK